MAERRSRQISLPLRHTALRSYRARLIPETREPVWQHLHSGVFTAIRPGDLAAELDRSRWLMVP